MHQIDCIKLVGVPCKILVMFSMETKINKQPTVGVPCKILVMFSFYIFFFYFKPLEYPAKF